MKNFSSLKHLLIFILANLFIITSITAQNNIWSLPPNYVKWIGNIPQPPQPLPDPASIWGGGIPTFGYDGSPALYSHNAMQDANGDLLFFIVDNYVYYKDGYTIGKIESLSGGTETMIVPDPGNGNS